MNTYQIGDFVVTSQRKLGKIKFFTRPGVAAVQYSSSDKTTENISLAALRKAESGEILKWS